MSKLLVIPNIDNLNEYEKLANEYGFGFEYNDFFVPNNVDDKDTLNSLINTYSKYNSLYNTLHGAFFDCIIFSYDEKIAAISKERVIESLDIARKLNCKKVVFHTNIDPFLKQEYYIKNWLDKNTIFFKDVAKKYKDIIIVIENMFDDSPLMLKTLIENINEDNVKACLDISHAYLSKTPVDEWIKELKPYISHIHINDNDGIVDSHLALGKGKIPYDKYLPLLTENDYTVLIEVSSIERLKDSIEYLKERGVINE